VEGEVGAYISGVWAVRPERNTRGCRIGRCIVVFSISLIRYESIRGHWYALLHAIVRSRSVRVPINLHVTQPANPDTVMSNLLVREPLSINACGMVRKFPMIIHFL